MKQIIGFANPNSAIPIPSHPMVNKKKMGRHQYEQKSSTFGKRGIIG